MVGRSDGWKKNREVKERRGKLEGESEVFEEGECKGKGKGSE